MNERRSIDSTGIHFAADEANLYGTTPKEFRLWIDYLFDIFHADLDSPIRRNALSISIAVGIWLLGFIPFALLNMSMQYVQTPGIYFFFIGFAWVFNALRWLSQVYHVRTNAVRVCFPLSDSEYRNLVSPFAYQATRNWRILVLSLPWITLACTYNALAIFGPSWMQIPLLHLAPASFPSNWHSGQYLVWKMLVIDMYCAIAVVAAVTGMQITLATVPLFRTLSKQDVVALPALITDRFTGILAVYQTGSVMWSFGVVLALLLFEAQLGVINVTFAMIVVILALIALLEPRRWAGVLWRKSKEQAIVAIAASYYNSSTRSDPETIAKLNQGIEDLASRDPSRIDVNQIFNVLINIVMPIGALALNTLRLG